MKKTVIIALGVTVTLLIGIIASFNLSNENTRDEENNSSNLSINNSETEINGQLIEGEVNKQLSETEIDWNEYVTETISLDNTTLNITQAGSYTISGESDQMIHVDVEGPIRLILDGVDVKTVDAAIYIENATKAFVVLKENTVNSLEDSSKRSDEAINGVLYSNSDFLIEGSGTLNVTSNFEDAIVSKDNLQVNSGNINIKSNDDGIRGNDSVTVSGGIINIEAKDDGIKTNNVKKLGKGVLTVEGGSIELAVGNDGLSASQLIEITNGKLKVITSTEGIEAPVINISGGDVDVYALDDGINASASEIISTGLSINISGGNVTVAVAQGDTDALDSNGDINISGGVITLTGQSPVDFDGNGTFTGGTLIINGEEVSELPNQFMGGGNRPGGGGFNKQDNNGKFKGPDRKERP